MGMGDSARECQRVNKLSEDGIGCIVLIAIISFAIGAGAFLARASDGFYSPDSFSPSRG
jgi:hypothetical protein